MSIPDLFIWEFPTPPHHLSLPLPPPPPPTHTHTHTHTHTLANTLSLSTWQRHIWLVKITVFWHHSNGYHILLSHVPFTIFTATVREPTHPFIPAAWAFITIPNAPEPRTVCRSSLSRGNSQRPSHRGFTVVCCWLSGGTGCCGMNWREGHFNTLLNFHQSELAIENETWICCYSLWFCDHHQPRLNYKL